MTGPKPMTELIKLDIKISCDHVALIKSVFERHAQIQNMNVPGVSRIKEMANYSALYELMDILGLSFEDDDARLNGTPDDVKILR